MRRVIVRVAFVLIVTPLAASGAAFLWWLPEPPGEVKSWGINAIWLRHQWVGESRSEADYDRLAARLQEADISDAFFHSGPFAGDGTVDPALYTNARTLAAELHERVPRLRIQAYLGQVERRGGGPLELDDEQTRRNVVETAAIFLDLGFDGIHYDIEPIYPGDESFLRLLEDTHWLTKARGKTLSTAIEQLEMAPGVQRLASKVVDRYHDPTKKFLRQVARRVDQVAIMTYDTGLPADFMFGAHMAWQTEHVVKTVHKATNGRTTVFMGIPTYDYNEAGFRPWAENVRSGVRGARKGLARLPKAQRANVGLALYPEWTMSDDDWDRFVDDWVR